MMKPENAGFWAVGVMALVFLYLGMRSFDDGGNFKPARGYGPQPPAVIDTDYGGRELVIRPIGGSYLTEAQFDGAKVPVLIDTGASLVTLRESDARRAGIAVGPRDFIHPSRTANGEVMTAKGRVNELRLGPAQVTNVEVAIIPDHLLDISLLGMNALNRFGRLEITANEMRLTVE